MQADALLRRQKIEAFFTRQPQTAEAIAEAASLFWQRLDVPLSRMVSVLGTASLFERCVDLNNIDYPWLPTSLNIYSPGNSIYLAVWHSLQVQTHTDALQAGVSLFSTFFELLAALIGERLTTRVFSLSYPDDNVLAGEPQ